MFCKNCGNQLNGTENVCPNCGVPVEKVEELTEAAPTVATVPEPTVAPTIAPIVEQAQPVTPVTTPAPTTPVQPATPVQQAAQTPQQGGQKNNTTLILVIVLVGLLVAGSIVFYTLNIKSAKTETTTPEVTTKGDDTKDNDTKEVDPTNPTTVGTGSDNKISYGGYTFTIPDGYKTEKDADLGLLVGNSSLVYSIEADYSNSFEKYQEYFTQKYPNEIKDAIETIGNRKYIIFRYKTDSGEVLSQYVTEASTGTTFVGLVERNDGAGATRSDYEPLTKILDSTSSSSSFAASDKKDAGENGVVDFKSSNGTIIDKFNK